MTIVRLNCRWIDMCLDDLKSYDKIANWIECRTEIQKTKIEMCAGGIIEFEHPDDALEFALIFNNLITHDNS